ncbi:MAG: hypothetical protein AAF696_10005, partial [Bacteroidota bacterium]
MDPSKTILPSILESKLSAIHEICTKFHVKKLWAIGSVLGKDFSESSDIDFLYEWDLRAIKEGEYLPNMDGCIAALEDLLERKIDFINYPNL